jgi:prepilin-type N-terminal cleavage/methylation domain-containing protein
MSFRHLRNRSAFTLIELLVVIAIIAILSVVVILTLNPQELLRQSRDSVRLSDMDTLNHAVGLYITDQNVVATFNLGAVSTTYISIPDPSATSTAGDQCQGLGLPVITISTYHCAASSTVRNIDGTGWIPVNFKNISSGLPLGNLPVDPVNQSSSNYFYTYQTNGAQYQITGILESQKYKIQYNTTAILPNYPQVISAGTNLNLSALYSQSGIAGYWPMDEGTGSTAKDGSGNGYDGPWSGTQAGTNSTYYGAGKIGSYAGYFNSTNNYIQLPAGTDVNQPLTLSAWVDPNIFGSGEGVYVISADPGARIAIDPTGVPQGSVQINGGWGGVASSASVPLNTWSYLVYVVNGGNNYIYVNGILRGSGSITNGTVTYSLGYPYVIAADNYLGTYHELFGGLIDDARIYNRALSAAEIQAIYAAQK